MADLIGLRQRREAPAVGGSPRAHRRSAKSALGKGARAVQKIVVNSGEPGAHPFVF